MRPIAQRSRADDDPARLPVEPRARGGQVRRADADPGGRSGRPSGRGKRAELAALPAEQRLTPDDVETIRAIGDNTGSMALKGANPSFEGEERPDGWALDERLDEVARRWSIDPARDLVKA